MESNDIKEMVKKRYGKIARKEDEGCGCSCCGTKDIPSNVDISRSIGCSDDEMNLVPEANLGLGCGNPTALGKIVEGETVMDLGSGAGFDCFLAARKVGETGKVIGVDMTMSMIDTMIVTMTGKRPEPLLIGWLRFDNFTGAGAQVDDAIFSGVTGAHESAPIT